MKNKFLNFFKNNYQKIIYLTLFFLVIFSFVYAIIFMSNMWILARTGYNTIGSYGSDKTLVYDYLNLHNNLIFISGVVLIVLFALAMLFGNKSRIKYYTSNIIFGFATGIASIVFSVVLMISAGVSKGKLIYASYAGFKFADGSNATEVFGKNFVNVILPQGFKEELGIAQSGGCANFTNPFSVDTPNFSFEGCNAMINLTFVLYTLIGLVGIGILALTIYKMVKSKKANKNVDLKEEM